MVVTLVMLFIKRLQKRIISFKQTEVAEDERNRTCKGVIQNLPNEYKSTEYLVTSGKSHKITQWERNEMQRRIRYFDGC